MRLLLKTTILLFRGESAGPKIQHRTSESDVGSECKEPVTNITNQSEAFQTCHQHISSQTSVTNIEVTHGMNSERIINDLMVQGQDVLTPQLQQRMINIITGK